MSLNDVWRNINREIGIYWRGRFDRVPDAPGVYAWFYPLRITSPDLVAFLSDVDTVLSFDARCNGPARKLLNVPFAWEELSLGIEWSPSSASFPVSAIATWKRLVQDEAAFDRLRRMVLKGSLLMPPLYVGKTNSLNLRCGQHRAGTDKNEFHSRYEGFARTKALAAPTVNDLLFACIQTEPSSDSDISDGVENLVEEILKRACRPSYSDR